MPLHDLQVVQQQQLAIQAVLRDQLAVVQRAERRVEQVGLHTAVVGDLHLVVARFDDFELHDAVAMTSSTCFPLHHRHQSHQHAPCITFTSMS